MSLILLNLGWRPEVRYILSLLDQSPGNRLIDRLLSSTNGRLGGRSPRKTRSDKYSVLQTLAVTCSTESRRERSSPAIHAHSISIRTCRVRAAAVLCYCAGSTATHENFHLTSSFHFILFLFSTISHSYFLFYLFASSNRLQLFHSCLNHFGNSGGFSPRLPERNTSYLELVTLPAWLVIHTPRD